MKKNVLCLALLAAISAGSAASAATALTGGKSVSLDGILADAENAPAKNVMAYSGNSLYASGNFDTPMGELEAQEAGSYLKFNAIKRPGRPEEIAALFAAWRNVPPHHQRCFHHKV